MRRFILLSLLSAPLAALPASAQEIVPPPPPGYGASGGVALIDNWIHQYLGRRPNREDIANGQRIDQGALDPVNVLAGILSCDEYYTRRAGGDDMRYVQALYRDVAGRAPSQREADYWYRRLRSGPEGMEGRIDVAYELLQRYPPNLGGAAPDDYDSPYRPRYYRDRDYYRDRRP
jgi:uncharacterized protein DUF4214